MNIVSKIVGFSLVASLAFNGSIQQAVGKPKQSPQCPNPFPSNYNQPATKKNVKIADLGIVVRVPVDQRLVYLKKERRFTFMTPPEYTSYQCSITKKKDYDSFYPYPHQLNYKVIKNPKKQSLEEILKESYKDTIFIDKLGQTEINGIKFLTTPIDQGDPTTGWFIPKARPDIVVEYTVFCDCGREYKDLIDDLNNIKNIVN